MKSTTDYALGHGFQRGESLETMGALSDDPILEEMACVRYLHGYVNPWQETEAFGAGGRRDAFAMESEHISTLADDDTQPLGTDDFDHSVIHGDEAAEWAAIGRRAFLKRMSEE